LDARTGARSIGACIPFVDPALPAPEAPLRWLTCPVVDAVAEPQDAAATTEISIAELSSARHVILGPAGEEDVLLRDSTEALTLRIHGARAAVGPVSASFRIEASAHADRHLPAVRRATDLLFRPQHRTNRSRDRLLERDALIALDADCAGASLRETAELMYGTDYVRREWPGKGDWLKGRIRRARAKGEELRDGGYRRWLQGGCRCSA
jgi:hypothetical protein